VSQQAPEKLVVTATEVEAVQVSAVPGEMKTKLPAAIPIWARLVLMPLVLVLPILCIVSAVLRVALRNVQPRRREAWAHYLNSLLIASGLLSVVATVMLFSYSPVPPDAISGGMADLDARVGFPTLPSADKFDGMQLSETMKPLVMVASPAQKRWFHNFDSASGMIGAAMLLHADSTGYLFATAKHVADGMGWGKDKQNVRVLLSSGVGTWGSATVIARHHDADVALLWVPRRSGHGDFNQPLATDGSAKPGETVYVIGHPEGLYYTVTNGIISRLDNEILQISAPVSPGNSGGPVYDDRGELLGVVSYKVDKSLAPNAENLNFAVNADLLRHTEGWDFRTDGRGHLESYLHALEATNPKTGK
jgi:S1-C subfamily serine protease